MLVCAFCLLVPFLVLPIYYCLLFQLWLIPSMFRNMGTCFRVSFNFNYVKIRSASLPLLALEVLHDPQNLNSFPKAASLLVLFIFCSTSVPHILSSLHVVLPCYLQVTSGPFYSPNPIFFVKIIQ